MTWGQYRCGRPIDNPMICDANVDLSYKDNMFNMFGGNIDNFMSLGYFNGHNAFVDPYYMYLVNAPRKIMWNTFFDFSFDFSMVFSLLKRALTFLLCSSSCSLIAKLVSPMLRYLTSFCGP